MMNRRPMPRRPAALPARLAFVLLAATSSLALRGSALAQTAPDDAPPINQSERNLGISSYVCTAGNDSGTQQCSVTCRSKELADCEDADGPGMPSCRCLDH